MRVSLGRGRREAKQIGSIPLGQHGCVVVLTGAFDKKYKSAYARLSGVMCKEELREKRAQPPSAKALDCRRSLQPPLQC